MKKRVSGKALTLVVKHLSAEIKKFDRELDRREDLPYRTLVKPFRYRKEYIEDTLRNRYRLLWELRSDASFVIDERNQSEWLDWSTFAGAPDWVIKKAKARSLTEKEYIGWRNAQQVERSTTGALAVRQPFLKAIMARLDAMEFDQSEIDIVVDVAQDHRVKPHHIVRWLEEERGRQSFEKVLYLLEMRRRFDCRVTYATLKKFLSDCNESREIFEQLLEYIEDYAGAVSDWTVWSLGWTMEHKFDGAADRLLAALNERGWPEICQYATKADRLTLAYQDLAELGWDADEQDFD